MGVVFDLAPPEIHTMAREVLEAHHDELKMPDGEHVTLCIMLARRDDDSVDPPVMLHGYECAAVIKVIPYKQRVDKRADAEITIDAGKWEDFTDEQRHALLDHEITHLEIQTDNVGLVMTDDQGRPKIKLRNHDWELGGFRSIAQRYGADAIEVSEARKFEERYGDVALQAAEKLFA